MIVREMTYFVYRHRRSKQLKQTALKRHNRQAECHGVERRLRNARQRGGAAPPLPRRGPEPQRRQTGFLRCLSILEFLQREVGFETVPKKASLRSCIEKNAARKRKIRFSGVSMAPVGF